VRGPPDNKQDGTPATEGPPQVVPPGTVAILPDQGDPRRIGELLGDWLAIRMAEVDDLVDEARSRVDAIPDQRVLFSLVGELVVLLRALELEVADLKRGRR
jgi:hypothetical protein